MLQPAADAPPPPPRLGSILTALSLLCATAWLVSRPFVGLDFTDEMQYYGEIASLVRTGKFFQVDLFLQQLGYVFLLPFFKLHAILFPDLSYLVLCGRLLLLGGYVLVGLLCWRSAAKLGGFSTQAKIAGLAAFAAWVPFQIFSPSYNSMSYLLVVGIAAVWLARAQTPGLRYVATITALLVALAFIYPPPGLALIATVLAEAAWRQSRRHAWELAVGTVWWGLVVAAVIVALQGPTLVPDLVAAAGFSRAFGVGSAMLQWNHLGALLAMSAACALFVRRLQLGHALDWPIGAGTPALLRAVALGALILGGGVLVHLMTDWLTGYFAAALLQLGLMLLAVSFEPAGNHPGCRDPVARSIMIAALFAGGMALLAITARWATGYFAPSIFTVLLMLAAVAGGEATDRRVLGELAIAGTILGAAFSFSSSNGIHNFGIGAAGVIPFLVLQVARNLAGSVFAARLPQLAQTVLPTLVLLVLLNAERNPFREQRGWRGFEQTRGVPAFKGIWVSPPKIEALDQFSQLAGAGLAGKRVLVTGPHPWLYFVAGGQPATSMFFMHFTWSEQVYEMVAERLFQGGVPDVIVVANGLPRPIHARVIEWSQKGSVVKSLALPPGFTTRYERLTRYPLAPVVLVLSRP